jgi:anaerobic ribonucleoside-triphosphate reductase
MKIKRKNMNLFKNLSVQELNALLKFPAYISLLAADIDDKLDEAEKKSAIKFAHTKTFSCDPLLTEFYKEADKVFKNNIDQLDKDLPKEKDSREAVIKKELLNLEKIVSKLGGKYTSTMCHSMKSFTEHVSKAHHNVLVDFIIPLSIPGLTDS